MLKSIGRSSPLLLENSLAALLSRKPPAATPFIKAVYRTLSEALRTARVPAAMRHALARIDIPAFKP
jgi:hypothetical protein